MTRRRETCTSVGLPSSKFPLPIFDIVWKRITVRGSLVGTRAGRQEALALAATYGISAHIETQPLAKINEVFDRLRQGTVQGRVVLDFEYNFRGVGCKWSWLFSGARLAICKVVSLQSSY